MASLTPAKAIAATCNDEGETLYSLSILLDELTTNESDQDSAPGLTLLAMQRNRIKRSIMRLIVQIFTNNDMLAVYTIYSDGSAGVYLPTKHLYFNHDGKSFCLVQQKSKITKDRDEWSEIKDLMYAKYPSELYEYFVNLVE